MTSAAWCSSLQAGRGGGRAVGGAERSTPRCSRRQEEDRRPAGVRVPGQVCSDSAGVPPGKGRLADVGPTMHLRSGCARACQVAAAQQQMEWTTATRPPFRCRGVGGAALPRSRQDRKDKEKEKRGRGQSSVSHWKSEAEMVLRWVRAVCLAAGRAPAHLTDFVCRLLLLPRATQQLRVGMSLPLASCCAPCGNRRLTVPLSL